MAPLPQLVDFKPFRVKMQRENIPDIVIQNFRYYFNKLVAEGQESGLIPESTIIPVTDVPDAEQLAEEYRTKGAREFGKTLLIKLNGGLGTSMGLNKAKSLLRVKEDLSFLEIIAQQAIADKIPLVLMDSFRTREDSIKVLERYPALEVDLPFDFLQHKVPKVEKADLTPADWPADPELEWCPPGHGDIYLALHTSGVLDKMLAQGYEYAFVSNADNLGAVVDPAILGYFSSKKIPFMMEVADRTAADRKGGHLAQTGSGQLILREIAQCPPKDLEQFQNIERHKYFNTNNLWINLPALNTLLKQRDYQLELPMIPNVKHVDPRNSESPEVYQLETAMGAAIAIFEGSRALRVPRSRFLPVKKTNDLLAVRSDVYILGADYQVRQNPERQRAELVIELDEDYYKLVDDMEQRFPVGPPSLIDAERLQVIGDIVFGADITIKDRVTIENRGSSQVKLPGPRTIDEELILE